MTRPASKTRMLAPDAAIADQECHSGKRSDTAADQVGF